MTRRTVSAEEEDWEWVAGTREAKRELAADILSMARRALALSVGNGVIATLHPNTWSLSLFLAIK